MDSQVLVSVIVPVYNVEKYLCQCVDSILAQTLKQIEIILVDDGSTDNSGSICDNYKKKHDNIKVIHKENAGLGFARNSGLEVAVGKYVGFVDSDDYIAFDMYEILVKNAEENGADASYALDRRFWRDNPDSNEKHNDYSLKVFGEDNVKKYVLQRIGTTPECQKDMLYEAIVCSGIFRLQLIKENHIQFVSEREIISEDIIFDIDFLPLCKTIVHCDAEVYFYRSNPKSLTMTYRGDRYLKNVDLIEIMENRLSKYYSKDELFENLGRYYITFVRVCFINEVSHIKKNGFAVCKDNIKKICEDEKLQKLLSEYNYKAMPKKYSIICGLTRAKAATLLIALVYSQLKVKGKL